jgi:hypothetical protein
MPAIVAFPTLVKDALAGFRDLCDNEPARHHYAEYLTGLMVAERIGTAHGLLAPPAGGPAVPTARALVLDRRRRMGEGSAAGVPWGDGPGKGGGEAIGGSWFKCQVWAMM